MADTTVELVTKGLYAEKLPLKRGVRGGLKGAKAKVAAFAGRAMGANGFFISETNHVAIQVFVIEKGAMKNGWLVLDSWDKCKTFRLQDGKLDKDVWHARSAAVFAYLFVSQWWQAEGPQLSGRVTASMLVQLQLAMLMAMPGGKPWFFPEVMRSNFLDYVEGRSCELERVPLIDVVCLHFMDNSKLYLTRDGPLMRWDAKQAEEPLPAELQKLHAIPASEMARA